MESAKQKAARLEKKQLGLCCYPGCNVPVALNKKARCPEHQSQNSKRIAASNRRLKIELMEHYGGCVCACCGEKELDFLTVDHINNDGAEHRRQLNGRSVYRWIKRQGKPAGFQVLCMNCNWSRSRFGTCPHSRDLCAYQPFTFIA